jgi:hypothetical protein
LKEPNNYESKRDGTQNAGGDKEKHGVAGEITRQLDELSFGFLLSNFKVSRSSLDFSAGSTFTTTGDFSLPRSS